MIKLFLSFFFLAALVQAQDELSIISPHWEGIRYEIGAAYSKIYQRNTGRTVKINWIDVGGTSEILRYVVSEFKNNPETIGVDLIFGGGTDPFVQLKYQGLLTSHTIPKAIFDLIGKEVASIPLHDPEGYYYSPVLAGFGIMCNSAVLSKLGITSPSTWQDLTQPKFFSWLGSGDPRKSGSVHMAYEILLQRYGWDEGWKLILAMAHNTRAFIANSAQVAKDIAAGEIACGLSIDSHAWAQVRELGQDQIYYKIPDDASAVNGDGVAILKGAPHLETSKAFINFLLSEEAQKLWYYRKGVPGGPKKYEITRLPVMPSLYADSRNSAIKINPFIWQSKFRYDNDLGSKRWSLVNDLFLTFIINRHRLIIANSATLLPVNEARAHEIMIRNDWSNPIYRAKIIEDWQEEIQSADKVISFKACLPFLILTLFLIYYVIKASIRYRLRNFD